LALGSLFVFPQLCTHGLNLHVESVLNAAFDASLKPVSPDENQHSSKNGKGRCYQAAMSAFFLF
jgi:hypothetical protein